MVGLIIIILIIFLSTLLNSGRLAFIISFFIQPFSGAF